MSSKHYTHVEQDPKTSKGGDELPTYNDLAVNNGPNSRFGRWREWIEKRASERRADETDDERRRRWGRGWGNEMEQADEGLYSRGIPTISNQPPTPGFGSLHIQTNDLNASSFQSNFPRPPSPALPPLPFVSTKLRPTHLKMNMFGSRFLPHATSPIRCILPLMSDRLVLIGHDEGLSVLDMYPKEWTGTGGIAVKGPEEALARPMWRGEGVYQMTILEVENSREGTPQGVVLALVGPESGSPSGKDSESMRALRMYNLASLTSLATWALAQREAHPLDLHRPSNWQAQQTPTKRHRPQSSIARSLKSLIDSPNVNQAPEPHGLSYHSLLSPSASVALSPMRGSGRHSPRNVSPGRNESDSSWDVIEDLPLRWALDFVPLATSGSRLVNSSILSYAMWSDDNRKGRGGQLLAVATKNNILLYETPKGERAFRFVKEFYTPMQPRSITFFQQSVEEVSRTSADGHRIHHPHKRSDSSVTLRGPGHRPLSSSPQTIRYGVQLALFVIFDKKAGWIRLADSAVGEVDMYDSGSTTGSAQPRDTLSPNASTIRRARASFEGATSSPSGKWVPPLRCELPLPGRPDQTQQVHLLTRGKLTHVVPCPLPVNWTSQPPIYAVSWNSTPTNVTARVCESDSDDGAPFLQFIAFGVNGVEVQEACLPFPDKGKGKGRGRPRPDDVRAEEDLGGDVGFLVKGGHWDQVNHMFNPQGLSRSYSMASDTSGDSFDSMESDDMLLKMRKEEGMYGWLKKSAEDWRVFWLGGMSTAEDFAEDDGR